jgi:hypothetical protein
MPGPFPVRVCNAQLCHAIAIPLSLPLPYILLPPPLSLPFSRSAGQSIETHSGYEVFTEGDAFAVAFHAPDEALGFAIDVQVGSVAGGREAAWAQVGPSGHPGVAPMPQARLGGALVLL